MTGEPGGITFSSAHKSLLPCLPFFLHPIQSLILQLGEGAREEEEGFLWAPCHFIVLGRRVVFFRIFLLSPGSCPRVRHRSTPIPPSSPGSAYSQSSTAQREAGEESAPSAQLVSSLQDFLFNIFHPFFYFFFKIPVLIFSPAASVARSTSFMCVTAGEPRCGRRRLPAAATTPRALPVNRCR